MLAQIDPKFSGPAQTETVFVELPAGVQPPFEVFVNGVPQREGDDYSVQGGRIAFDRALAKEGKLGFWRWLVMFIGIAGFYGQNDSIDVTYGAAGKRHVATGLPIRRDDQSG